MAKLISPMQVKFQKQKMDPLFQQTHPFESTQLKNRLDSFAFSSKNSEKQTVQTETISLEEDNALTVAKQYIQSGFPALEYQQKLEKALSNCVGQREKAVCAALFLATKMPKLPYFWGGGHDVSKEVMSKINPEWGTLKEISYDGDEDYVLGSMHPNSLDCSGFVTWCLTQAGFPLEPYLENASNYCLNSSTIEKLGSKVSLTDPMILSTVKVGDIGYMKGHVGMVVDVNQETKEITFAHISGSGYGMNLTTMSTETGKITKDDQGVLPTVDLTGSPLLPKERIGNSYFTDIITIPYEN